MKIKFWGVRGSIGSAIPGAVIRQKIKDVLTLAKPADVLTEESIEHFINSLSFSLAQTYGGNTSCIEVRTDEDKIIILDAGTGIRPLGNELMKGDFGKGKGELSILFSHSHWDHIQGLPFFVPLLIPGNRINMYGVNLDIQERLQYQTPFTHFPLNFKDNAADKHFYKINEGQEMELYGCKITNKAMRHPGTSYSYGIEQNGKRIIFGSDSEFNIEEMEKISEYIEYFKGADVLIFDTQYTFEESVQRIDWGHSSASIATDIALQCKVKKLVLFHHDPSYPDDKLDAVYLRALKYKEMMSRGSDMEIVMAHEGLEIEV